MASFKVLSGKLHDSIQISMWWQLRDDLMTMLIAGHETTAAVLTWATFMLAQVISLIAAILSS